MTNCFSTDLSLPLANPLPELRFLSTAISFGGVCIYVYMFVYRCVQVCGVKKSTRVSPSVALCLILRYDSLNLELTGLPWLASRTQGPYHLHLPQAGTAGVSLATGFYATAGS